MKTKLVYIGKKKIGADEPILVQSMTSTPTENIEATIDQAIKMIEAGCELVRITAPSLKEAQDLEKIKKGLRARGFDTPLVADIHFTPNAAMEAALHVEKVRINPGNYADKKKFENLVYTPETYQKELDKIEEKLIPLIERCKKNQVALRIGVNHGSLSDRILSRYGDTPKGMVESAMEFLRICEKMNFDQIVISMKASNVIIMVAAYRAMRAAMEKEKMNFPLHLGVTEAGDGEDGRIKSALGIGTLLAEGIGDTIRVSLTEDPEKEMPVAKKIVDRYKNWIQRGEYIPALKKNYQKRNTLLIDRIGAEKVPVVVLDRSYLEKLSPAAFFPMGWHYSPSLDKWQIKDQAADYIYIGDRSINFEIGGNLGLLQNAAIWQNEKKQRHYPLFEAADFLKSNAVHPSLNFVRANTQNLQDLLPFQNIVLVFTADQTNKLKSQRDFCRLLNEYNCHLPLIFWEDYSDIKEEESLMLAAAVDLGALFLEGYGNGIALMGDLPQLSAQSNKIAFGILQAARQRISKTEYIACPSCGRTEFDLQSTTQKIREKTHHLKGIKIGIMGCIVNGPGEMADADYGYVGTGKGKITLYKEKNIVQKNIPQEQAVEALIDLIKKEGDWVEMKDN